MKCPSCGAMIDFEESRAFMFCPYCGSKVTRSAGPVPTSGNEPNLYINYSTNNTAVGMVTRIVSTGTKSTYVNNQTLSFHLTPGNHTIVLKIGKTNYNRNIVIPQDNTPVRIYASFNGTAQILIDQPTVNVAQPEVNSSFNSAAPSFSGNSANASNSASVARPAVATSASTSNKSSSNNKLFILLGIIGGSILLIMFMGLVGLSTHSQGRERERSQKYNLYLDIASETNLFYNTYDITISLDGKELGSVSNGKNFTYLAEVRKGSHELSFCQTGKSSPKGTKTITVSNDMTYSCELSHDGFSIKIKNESFADNIDGSSLAVIDVTGIPLDEAKANLEKIGFTNIREEPYSDIWERGNWIVVSQDIAPGTCIDKNDRIQLNCVKGSDYFDKDYMGKNISECQLLAEGQWYSLTFRKDNKSMDVSAMSDEEKADWIVTYVGYGRAYKEVYLDVEYIGETTSAPTPTPKPTSVPSTTDNTSQTTSSNDDEIYYSSNSKDTYKDGNTGVYSYSRNAGSYEIYIIIDFDEGYVYYFCEGNGDDIVDRLEIDSGDLNSLCFYYYHYDDESVCYAVNWAFQRQPNHLVLQDEFGGSWDYYPTDLDKAISLRDSKEVVDY